MSNLTRSLGYIAWSIVALMVNGLILAWLWGDFIAEPFGVMPLNLGHSIGLCLIARLTTLHTVLWKDHEPNIAGAISFEIAIWITTVVYGLIANAVGV